MFLCPHCKSFAIQNVEGIELLPQSPMAQEESLTTIHCTQCSFKGMAIYTESSSGADFFHFHHEGYPLDEKSFRILNEWILKSQSDKAQKQKLEASYAKHFSDTEIKMNLNKKFKMELKNT